jgi:type IX secretion system PorP/SprF family membrane protein
MSLKSLFLIISLYLVSYSVDAQDPEFTQVMATPMYFNPAFAGFQQNLRTGYQLRNQWPSVSGSYITSALSADMGFPKAHSGIGILMMADEAGDGQLTTGSVNAVYSYEINLGLGSYLRFGAYGGIFRRSINFSQLYYGDQIDPKTGFIYNSQEKLPAGLGVQYTPVLPDFGTGALYYNKVIYAGISVSHLFEPEYSFFGNVNSILYRRYTLQAGGFIGLGDWNINPNLLLMHQGDFTQVLPGVNVNYHKFTLGTSFRMTDPNADAVNFLLGFNAGKFKFCLSYDKTISDAREAAAGSFELSVVFQLSKPRDISAKPMITHLMGAF